MLYVIYLAGVIALSFILLSKPGGININSVGYAFNSDLIYKRTTKYAIITFWPFAVVYLACLLTYTAVKRYV